MLENTLVVLEQQLHLYLSQSVCDVCINSLSLCCVYGCRPCLMALAGRSERNCAGSKCIEADQSGPGLLGNLCVIESGGHRRETALPRQIPRVPVCL